MAEIKQHLSINFIGCGRLGQTLARLLVAHQAATITAVCNRSLSSAQAAVDFIGQGLAVSALQALPLADIMFITTYDDAIAEVVTALVQAKVIKHGCVLVHCSGVLPSSILKLGVDSDYSVVSVHPMKSFVTPKTSVETFNGTYCACEGDVVALTMIEPLFQAIQAKTYRLNSAKKVLYHASAVFSANYLQAIAQSSLDCLQQSDVADEDAFNIVMALMQGALDNLKRTGSPKAALTGPLIRGDVTTVQEHLKALNGDEKKSYQLLALKLLALVEHPPALHKAFLSLLSGVN